MKRTKKHVEVNVNFPGETLAEDEQLTFCVKGASEHKAVSVAKDIVEQSRPGHTYSGRAVRKEDDQ